MVSFKGKTVLVTGAAKRLGAVIARAFAGAGARVIVHYRSSQDEARELAEELEGFSVQADLAEPDSIAAMFDLIERECGRLDVLVNSAAIFGPTEFENSSADEFDRYMAVNARSVYECSRHAVRLMGEGSSIVNMADMYALRTLKNHAPYIASKAVVIALTKSLAVDLAPRIRVNAVAPGFILPAAGSDPERNKMIIEKTPLKRAGTPEEVAETVLFLSRSDSTMTGQVLILDGGRSLTF